MKIAILLYDRFTALDAIGPYEVLGRIPGAELRFVAAEPGVKRSDQGCLGIEVTDTLQTATNADIVLVPGGPGSDEAERDERVLDWLRAVDATTQWTTSVCTGSLILGAAGLLDGRRATTYWAVHDRLAEQGAEVVAERFVTDGKYVTAAGVSAGIDMALHLASLIGGTELAEALALGIEYDPQPPVPGGLDSARPEIVELLREMRAEREREAGAAA